MGRPHAGIALRQTLVAALAVALGATCLHAVLLSNHWYAAVLLVIGVVALLGLGGRRLDVPPVLIALVQLLGIVVVCTRLFAHRAAFGGIVPTPAAMRHLGTLSAAGADDLRSVLFPTAATPDLAFLAVALCGLVALAVDLLAAGARRPAFAGLPLVLLVALPAAVRERSVGFLPLLATALGFLLLLTLDGQERTSRWGRALPAPGAELPSSVAGAAGPAVRIGLLSVALAVIVPVAIPGANSSPFGVSGAAGSGSGAHASATIVDPLVSVSADLHTNPDQVLLTVRTRQTSYLRLTALDEFGEGGFSLGAISAGTGQRVSHGIAADPALLPDVPTLSVTDTVSAAGALQEMLLPVPYGTDDVSIDGDWRLSSGTRTIFSASASTSGAQWQADAQVPEPTAAQLAADGEVDPGRLSPAILDDTDVPGDLPSVVRQTAQEWTAGQTTEYGKALAIQRHFTDGSFTYSTGVQFQPGMQGFVDFLTDRKGFCEQYATTMTAMLRSLGIPARVAIGFVPGSRTPDGSYAVTGGDAHAWPEVWFAGVGWVRFEPTPRSDGRDTPPAYTTGQGTTGGGGGTTAPHPSTAPAPTPTASAPGSSGLAGHKKTAGSGPAGAASGRHRTSATPWVLLGLLVLVLLLAAPGLAGLLVRRRRRNARGAGSIERIWRQLLDDATDVGAAVPAGASPRAAGAVVLRAATPYGDPGAAVGDAVGRLVGAVERTRYGRDDEGVATASLADDERLVRRTLLARRELWQRALVGVLPASGRDRARLWAGSLLPRALSALDRLTPRRGAMVR